MSRQDFWEQKYAGGDYLFGTEPNDFLVEQAARLVPGAEALAVADGEGRNGVWLAEQGLRVVSVDFSGNALAKARALAARRGVEIETVQADLLDWDWPVSTFDLVVSFFIHPLPEEQERLLAAMIEALRPGGLLLFEAYSKAHAGSKFGGPDDPARLYAAAAMRRSLAGAEIVRLEETTVRRRSGRYPGKPAAVVRMVARRRPAA
jgi:SAM-dependent methyltransferase